MTEEISKDAAPPAPESLPTVELWRRVVRGGHAVPRPVIEECARRGDEALDEIARVVETDYYWAEDAGESESWLPLHAAMVAGLIPNERAGTLLLGCLIRTEESEDYADWLDGAWAVFFRDKPDATAEALRALAEDASHQPRTRSEAAEAYLAHAADAGRLQVALDWAAAIVFSPEGSREFGGLLARTLLLYAQPEHRAELEALADRQGRGALFPTRTEIREAYAEAARRQTPYKTAYDPWSFYDQERIEAREREFEAEAPVETFVRETPKVGRNDPCPCGSGKKYKKCCLSQHEQ